MIIAFSSKISKSLYLGLEKLMPQLFVVVYRTKTPYLRNVAALHLLADFGLYPINSFISVHFYLKNSNLDIFEDKVVLKFENLRNPSICSQKIPSFLSDEWTEAKKTVFFHPDFPSTTFMDLNYVISLKNSTASCLDLFQFQIKFENVAGFLESYGPF